MSDFPFDTFRGIQNGDDVNFNSVSFPDGSDFSTATKIQDDTTSVSVDGSVPTVNFTIGNNLSGQFLSNRLQVPEIRAPNTGGLKLYNSSGSQGVFVSDSGQTNVTGYLDVADNFKNKGFESFTYTNNTLFLKLQPFSGVAFKIRSYTSSGLGNNNVTVYASHFNSSSDDRQKAEETPITNATEIIKKLKPQRYKKYGNFDLSGDYVIESGLIAQEVWNDCPELRHLVDTGNDASGNPVIPSEMDLSNVNIGEDPDYEAHGWTDGAGLNYDGLIAYLIKSNQELEARISALEN